MSGDAAHLDRFGGKAEEVAAADDPPRLDVRVLGPVEIMVGGRPLSLGGRQVRLPLAVLAANAGRVVPVSALVAALWGPDAPVHAERTVRKYVSRLRQALLPAADGEAGLVVTHPAGYLLRLSPDVLDAARFEHLASHGRSRCSAASLTAITKPSS
jgi:DNA-binding SARP family transcriptional activator